MRPWVDVMGSRKLCMHKLCTRGFCHWLRRMDRGGSRPPGAPAENCFADTATARVEQGFYDDKDSTQEIPSCATAVEVFFREKKLRGEAPQFVFEYVTRIRILRRKGMHDDKDFATISWGPPI